MRQTIFLLLAGVTFFFVQHPNLVQAQTHAEHAFTSAQAPGAPGATPYWTSGDKQGVGTSTTRGSHVWFTLGNGALNEVYYPAVDKANTRDLELIVTDGKTFTDVETLDTLHSVAVPDPAALIITQINTARSGRYRISKTYVTDPVRDALLIRLKLDVLQPGPALHVWVYYDPSLNNCGLYGTAYSQGNVLVSHTPESQLPQDAANAGATRGDVSSALMAAPGFAVSSNGFVGVSDGWDSLRTTHTLSARYERADGGNVAQIAELPEGFGQGETAVLALSFGATDKAAVGTAAAALQKGFDAAARAYADGWHQYIASLRRPEPQYQRQFQMAAMVLRAHEDKLHPGALAASLTIPWGDASDASVAAVGGYHVVWSRDLYQAATAFLAMGDRAAALRGLKYLFNTQQRPDGSFPQNSWLDGKPWWTSLQLDEVSYPIILAWQLNQTDTATYEHHIRTAANFLVQHGPATPEERWEEMSGYAPSTIAAEIAGLICAADIASRNGDTVSAELWTGTADAWARNVNAWMVTTTGSYGPRYFIRISPHGNPNSGEKLVLKNGAGLWDESEIVDAGFLELVRLGIRRPNDPVIAESVKVIDRTIMVNTPEGPGWYRYTHDGYGEHADGEPYNGSGIGRLWPLLTGERGEYEVANGRDATPYLDTMEKMAGPGGMLSEQVWDRLEQPKPGLQFGKPTGSANPLAWTCAQFIRLALAQKEGRLPETPQIVLHHFEHLAQ
jgi:glucan 1,4-alpha-glucosidase